MAVEPTKAQRQEIIENVDGLLRALSALDEHGWRLYWQYSFARDEPDAVALNQVRHLAETSPMIGGAMEYFHPLALDVATTGTRALGHKDGKDCATAVLRSVDALICKEWLTPEGFDSLIELAEIVNAYTDYGL